MTLEKIRFKIPTIRLFTFLLIMMPFWGIAQQGSTVAGATISNANTDVSFTIGETIVSSYSNGDIKVTNGIIQPVEVNVLATNDLINADIQVFPNPSSEILNLRYDDVELKTFEVFSLENRLVLSGTISNRAIDISSINTGLFLLRLKSEEGTYSTLITKINL